MGFESYTVLLVPKQLSSPATNTSKIAVSEINSELRRKWPAIRLDKEELQCLSCPLVPGEIYLVHETVRGLIQVLLTPSQGQVRVSVRFAYCNPRTVYKPFIEIIVWLMERYDMCAFVMASDDVPGLTDPQKVENVLVSSIDYNRRLWQADARTDEEAILRPGDAIVRFISPHSLNEAVA